MNEKPQIKCELCGISIPDVPEDATFDELLCNSCYEQLEPTQLNSVKCPQCHADDLYCMLCHGSGVTTTIQAAEYRRQYPDYR